MLQSLKIFAVVLAVVALFATTRADLDNIRGLTTDNSYFTVQLAEATRLEKEMLRFRTDAAALVRGDAGADKERVKLSFDLLWSRVNTEATRVVDARLRNLHTYRTALTDLSRRLTGIDADVQALHTGDAAGLARIEAAMRASEAVVNEMNSEAYSELYQKSSDTAIVQRNALRSLDRVQWILLIVGFLGFILLLWQLRKGERLYAALEAREAEIRNMASVDALTGLRNRRYFDERMAAIDAGDWHGPLQALLIDLDGFKPVNDRFGHAAGDHVLREVSARVAGLAGKSKLVARHGGDEFAVVFDGTAPEACRLARAILQAIDLPITFEGHALQIGASVGLAQLRRGERSSAALLKAADDALYEAKSQGRGRVRCHCASQGDVCPAAGAIGPALQAAAS